MIKYILGVILTFVLFNCGGEPGKPYPIPCPDCPTCPDCPELPPEDPTPDPEEPTPDPTEPKPEIEYCAQDADFSKAQGKYQVRTKSAGGMQMAFPTNTNGCKIIPASFCNGTGGRLIMFSGHAKKLASHGFFVTSYETTSSGSGKQAMQAFEYSMRQPENKAFVLGMSQGGQCVVSTQFLLEKKYPGIYAPGVPMVPAFGMSNSRWQSELPKIKSQR